MLFGNEEINEICTNIYVLNTHTRRGRLFEEIQRKFLDGRSLNEQEFDYQAFGRTISNKTDEDLLIEFLLRSVNWQKRKEQVLIIPDIYYTQDGKKDELYVIYRVLSKFVRL
jgi:hypothetical protein